MSEVETDTELNTEVEQPEIDVQALLEERERLLKHNETLLAEKKAKQEQARQAQLERERLEQEQARKNGDIEKLEQAWQDKLKTYEQKVQELQQQRDNDLLERESHKVAQALTDNSANQQLLKRFVQDRLAVSDGQVRALDANGQPINRVDELITEFKTCGLYDSLITGTRASGTGGTGSSNVANKSPTEMTEVERLELKRTNPEQFKQLFLTQKRY